MVREPHGLLEEVNWSAEKSKYNLRSILKSCFLGQIELSFFYQMTLSFTVKENVLARKTFLARKRNSAKLSLGRNS